MRARGATLLELLLAMGLLLVLFQVVLRVLFPALGMMRRTAEQSGLQQQALVTLSRIERNLRRSSPAAISLKSSGEEMVLGAQRLQAPSHHFAGTAQWEPALWVLVYRRGQRRLTEAEVSNPVGIGLELNRPHQCSAAELTRLATVHPTSVLGTNVGDFELLRSAQAVFTVQLELEGEAGRYQLSRTFATRNP